MSDTLLYRLLYTEKYSTKDNVAAIINSNNNTTFARQSYESKDSNILLEIYSKILNDNLKKFFL